MRSRCTIVCALVAAALLPAAGARGAAAPHESYRKIPFSNGYSPAVYDVDAHRLNAFHDHLYRDFDGATPSTDLCWDAYWGVNAGGSGVWLGERAEESASFEEGTGIVHVARGALGMQLDEYYFSPFGFDGPLLVMLVRVTNGGTPLPSASLFALLNFHVGAGAPEAGFASESVAWASGRFVETGAATGHTFVYRPLVAPYHRRTDFAAGAGNPYLHVGAPGLENRDSTGGTGDDAVAAFEWYLAEGGSLPAGATRWHGVAIAYGRNPDVAALDGRLTAWIGGRGPEAILEAERAAWAAWHAAGRDLPGAIADAGRLALARQSLAMLRMGQVREAATAAGKPTGQIVASMPPGMWNITWPRDQAYATAALVETGHFPEARGALEFVLDGDAGQYAAQLGVPDYLVSVCRYYGGGKEESDGDPATVGPNIELDNFGLFLWALAAYVAASGDGAFAAARGGEALEGAADVLVALVEPATGLLPADSSIWERHWNGNQKHFAYSNIMAVVGLCGAARLAGDAGDTARQRAYMETARTIRDAVATRLVGGGGTFIAQSLEEIASGSCVDASVVEALVFGLVGTSDPLYRGTLDAMSGGLWMESTARGYRRNDDGDWYDRQEWVFVDLRIALAHARGGNAAHAGELIDWVTAQSAANRGLIAELYDAERADYAGAVPMMGFGAGAYLLALLADPASDSVAGCLTGDLPEPGAEEEGGAEACCEEAGEGETAWDEPVEPAGDADTADDGKDASDARDARGDGVHEEGAGCGCRMAL